MHSPVNLRHARLINFVDGLLRAYIEEENLGELHRETVAVRLSLRETFMPDLAYPRVPCPTLLARSRQPADSERLPETPALRPAQTAPLISGAGAA